MNSGLEWGDIPTWLAAIGTIGAVLVALWLALREGRRQARQQRRHQAESVTAWLTGPPGVRAGLVIQNASSQLIYQVIANLVITRGAGTVPRESGFEFRTFHAEVPPGRTDSEIDLGGGVGVFTRWGVELAFRDAAGRSWLREANSELVELKASPAEHYGLDEPVPWSGPGGDYEGP